MIDRRKIKTKIIDNMQNISETEIMLNYSDFLKSSYPYLLKIDYCYDPYDDFLAGTFSTMVHDVFLYKYGISLKDRKRLYQYGLTMSSYRNHFHIEITPKKYPVIINFDESKKVFENNNDQIKFVFKSFTDGIRNLGGHYEEDENMPPNMVEMDIFYVDTGKIVEEYENNYATIDKEDIEFEYVLEDYRKK
ncbi:MAG: hypothetical protein LBT84_06750 [Spirochaetia bacterium]|jgi:hypothetical protein|nr:hypothetical protein [Spirochaetia bacterium]